MKFSIGDISQITFQKGLRGYLEEDVNDFMKKVREDYQEYNKRLQDKDQDLAAAQEAFKSQLDAHKLKFQAEKEELNSRINRIQSELDWKNREMDNLREIFASQVNSPKPDPEVQQELERRQAEVEALKAENEELQAQLEQAKQAVEPNEENQSEQSSTELTAILDNVKSLVEREQEAARKKFEGDRLQALSELSVVNERKNEKEAELASLQDKIRELEMQEQELQQNREEHQAQFAEMKEEAESLRLLLVNQYREALVSLENKKIKDTDEIPEGEFEQ
jgi:DivIVA domain-containing protein